MRAMCIRFVEVLFVGKRMQYEVDDQVCSSKCMRNQMSWLGVIECMMTDTF